MILIYEQSSNCIVKFLPVLQINFNFFYRLLHLLGLFVFDEGVFELLIILDAEFFNPREIIRAEKVDTVHLLLYCRPLDILGRHANLTRERCKFD